MSDSGPSSRARLARSCRAAAVSLAVVASGAACAGSPAGTGPDGSSYYLSATHSEIVLITWGALQNGHAAGSSIDNKLTGTAPGELVSTNSAPINVAVRGRTVTFSATGLLGWLSGGAAIQGTLSGSTLSVTGPTDNGQITTTTLTATTPQAYNADLAALRRRASHDNAVANQQIAQQQAAQKLASDQQTVANDESGLAQAVSQLPGDLSQIGGDVQQGQTDLGTLDSDAAAAGQDCVAVNDVFVDANGIQVDANDVQVDLNGLTSELGSVQGGIAGLQNDVQTVQNDGGSPPGDPAGSISSAQSAVSSAVSQANADITTMNGYLKQAADTANALAGSSGCGNAPETPQYLSTISA